MKVGGVRRFSEAPSWPSTRSVRRLSLLAPFLCSLLFSCASTSAPPPVDEARSSEQIVAIVRKAFPAQRSDASSAKLAALRTTTPSVASGALHVGLDERTWIEARPRGARDVVSHGTSGAVVYPAAFDGADLVYVVEPARAEELRVARTLAAASHLSWDLRLGPGLAAFRVRDGRVEALDERGAVRLSTEPAWAVDAAGVHRALSLSLHGATLEATLDTSGLAAPIAIDPAWTSAGTLSAARVMPGAARLASGKVLVAGGSDGTHATLATAELYDPATNSWTTTSAPMTTGRNQPTATAFASGTKVLLAGGDSDSAMPTTADIYDAATDKFTSIAMPQATRGHSSTLLADGKVALIGGRDQMGNFIQTVRTFNPSTSSFTSSGTVFYGGLTDHSATLLPSGKVFVAGGRATSGPPGSGVTRIADDTWMYDPATQSVTKKTSMLAGRLGHGAVYVSSGTYAGKVLLFAGSIRGLDDTSEIASAGSVFYDVAADSFSLGPFLSTPRTYFGWSVLPSGKVVVTGGAPNLSSPTMTADDTGEVFDPLSGAWASAGKMASGRAAGIQVTLDGESVLVAAGVKAVKEGFLDPANTAEKLVLQGNGNACDAAGQCTSGFCVDGVCCNTACADTCAACDVSGKVGTCSAVSGAPHGTRPACDASAAKGDTCALACDGSDTKACHYPPATTPCSTDACTAGVETHASTCDGAGKCKDAPTSCGDFVCGATACKTACASKADCVNPDRFCEAGKCIPFLSNGIPCTRDDACASGHCIDGTCCESTCDGQCEACDVPGQAGKCVPVKGKPHGMRIACPADDKAACGSKVCDGSNTAACAGTLDCGNYGCDTAALVCKHECGVDSDCAAGFECKDAKCVPQTSKCSSDLTEMVGTDGSKSSCAPYLCRDGVCLTDCKSSSDCQGGFLCDPSQHCVAPASGDTGSSGGCAVSQQTTTRSFAWILLASVVVALRRRRR